MPTELSRRDFLRLAAGTATALSMSVFMVPFIEEAAAGEISCMPGNGARKELSPEEKALSYAKYYYMEMAKPDPSLIEAVKNGPIDWKNAINIKEINELIKPGYREQETGYCLLPDGTGMVSALTKMPGVTVDMINWWFVWHPLHPLRYKIWDPEDHFDTRVSEKDRQRLTDQTIPLDQRNWGCTHIVREDIGLPALARLFLMLMCRDPLTLKITFYSPGAFGFDMSKYRTPEFGTAICGVTDFAIMCHFVREIENGVEMRSRFWFGYKFKEGKFVKDWFRMPPSVLQSIMRNLNLHCIKEYTNLARILPLVYSEEGNKPIN